MYRASPNPPLFNSTGIYISTGGVSRKTHHPLTLRRAQSGWMGGLMAVGGWWFTILVPILPPFRRSGTLPPRTTLPPFLLSIRFPPPPPCLVSCPFRICATARILWQRGGELQDGGFPTVQSSRLCLVGAHSAFLPSSSFVSACFFLSLLQFLSLTVVAALKRRRCVLGGCFCARERTFQGCFRWRWSPDGDLIESKILYAPEPYATARCIAWRRQIKITFFRFISYSLTYARMFRANWEGAEWGRWLSICFLFCCVNHSLPFCHTPSRSRRWDGMSFQCPPTPGPTHTVGGAFVAKKKRRYKIILRSSQ